MLEALRLVIPYAFETLRLHRIEAACIPDNARSVRVLEKAGFQREGLLRSYLRINGSWQDHYLYALVCRRSAAARHEALCWYDFSRAGTCWHLRSPHLSRCAPSRSAHATEPIKISRDDVALDLSGAVEIYRNQGENFQVSTAPGPDGIVRRIEVEANDARSTGDWAVFALANTTDTATRSADRGAAFPPGEFRTARGRISDRAALPPSPRAKASRLTGRQAPTQTCSG